MKNLLKKVKWKKIIIWAVVLVIIVIAANFTVRHFTSTRAASKTTKVSYTTVKVETRDIQNVLSSSGSIEPLNTYNVQTLAEGEIVTSDFEEGDMVEKGQLLYQISTDNLDSKIDTARTGVTRAQDELAKAKVKYTKAAANYKEAKEAYEEACDENGDPDMKSTETGTIRQLYVKQGDKIQNGTQIAEIYDNESMLLEVPFNASEADASFVGKTATVTMSDSFETLNGTVTRVSGIEDVLSGNRLVRTVTIRVANPGGITAENKATASVGDIYSSDEGTFKVSTDAVISSDTSGKIASLLIEEGSRIAAGDTILVLEQSSIDELLSSSQKAMENAQDAVDSAQEAVDKAQDSVEDANTSLKEFEDSRDDYRVTAPISGQVIRKDALTGDTINANSSLCTIYDLSSVKFDMSIDELDVLKVKVGQEVDVTADALTDEKLTGVITNISLESTASQGVTQYPVTVRLDDTGELLPGMNVTGEIILEKAEGVLAIPSDALMRGDQVYVADSTVKEADGEIPAGFKAVKVETGITDGDYIEIKSGLTGTEEVYAVRASGTENMNSFMPGNNMMQGGDFNFSVPQGGNGGGQGNRSNFNRSSGGNTGQSWQGR